MTYSLYSCFVIFKIKNPLWQYSCQRGTFYERLNQLDDSSFSSIATASAGADDSGVAAVALLILGSNFVEQLLGNIFLGQESQSSAIVGQAALLAEGDELFNNRLDFLCTIERGFELAVLEQIGGQLTKQGLSLRAGLAQLT